MLLYYFLYVKLIIILHYYNYLMSQQQSQEQSKVDDKNAEVNEDPPQEQEQLKDGNENNETDPGQPQWDLNEEELQILQQIQAEIEETQRIADMIQEEANEGDATQNRARNTLNTVNNVVEVMKDDQNLKEVDEELKFAIENTLIQLQIKNRRLGKEKEELRQVIMSRNEQVRYLLDKVHKQEQELFAKQNELERLRQQVHYQDRNINKLQEKVDDEYRTKLIQEQLRGANQKPSQAQNQYKQMMQREQNQEIPLFLTANKSGYVDGNLKEDQYNFWMNENDKQMEYPGDPKRLHDVVNQKNLWVGKIEDEKLQRFQYQRGQKADVSENKSRQQKQLDDQFWGS